MNLVIQSFGGQTEYNRAIFTILSFYTHTTLPINQTNVLLFTDNPEYFKNYLKDLTVTFILLTPEKIKWMRGDIDFLHRMKIALIEEAFSLTSGTLLYTDSDCFFIADPSSVTEKVSAQTAFMHLPEYPFVKEVEDKTDTYKNFHHLISRQDFKLTNGSKLKVVPQHFSWNAGVMAFHPSHSRFIPDVYALTDQFYPACGSHASEQYAFSLVMQENTQLKRCDDVVYHYWYRVKKRIMDQFLEKKLDAQWSLHPLSIKLKTVMRWTQGLPNLFEKHIWTIQDHAVQAFNLNNFSEAYKWSLKAVLKEPFESGAFLKDVIYHTRRKLNRNA